jgi:hypothetical protein
MFTQDDCKRLECFCEVCDKIAGCRFIRDFHKQSHHIFVGTLPDGRVVDEYPRYDDDDFRAFMTHYRKLRMEREPTNLFAIMKLLKWKGSPDERNMFDHYKKEIKEEGQGWWGAVIRDQNSADEWLTQEKLEELFLYGDVSHVNLELRDRLAKVVGKAGLMKTLSFVNYIRFARIVVSYAQKTAEIIRSRGYLTV